MYPYFYPLFFHCQRGKHEILGLIAFRSRLYAEFKIDLPTKEIELLMSHFDPQKKDEIDLNLVLGSAQLNYDKWKKGKQDLKGIKKLDSVRQHRLEQRQIHLSKRSEGIQKSSEMLANILNILKEHSFNLLITKDTRLTAQSRRLVMNSSLFQALLDDLGIRLSSKERKLLEERYIHTKAGTIDFLKFKSEFLTLGAEMLLQKRRLTESNLAKVKEKNKNSDSQANITTVMPEEVKEDEKNEKKILNQSLKSVLKSAPHTSCTPSLDNSYDSDELLDDSQNISGSLNSSTALSIIPNFMKMSNSQSTTQSSFSGKMAIGSKEMQTLAANQPNYMNKLVLTNNDIEDIFAAVASTNNSVNNTPMKSAMKMKGSARKLKPLAAPLSGTGHFRKNRKASTIVEDDADYQLTGSQGNTAANSEINTARTGKGDADNGNEKSSTNSKNLDLDSSASNFNCFSPLTTRGKTGEQHCFGDNSVLLDGLEKKNKGVKGLEEEKGNNGIEISKKNGIGKNCDEVIRKGNGALDNEIQKMLSTNQEDELSIESHKPFSMGGKIEESTVINDGEWLTSSNRTGFNHINGGESHDTALSEVSSSSGFMGELIIDNENDSDNDNKGDDCSNFSPRRGGGGMGGPGTKSVISAAGTEITEQILLKHYSGKVLSQMNMKNDNIRSKNALESLTDDFGSIDLTNFNLSPGDNLEENKTYDEEMEKKKRDEEEDEREAEKYVWEEAEEEEKSRGDTNDINENSNFESKNVGKLSKSAGIEVEVEVEAEVVAEEEQDSEFKIYDPRQDSNLSNSVNLRMYKECPEVEIEDKVGINSVNQ